jgi:hypothetical protein
MRYLSPFTIRGGTVSPVQLPPCGESIDFVFREEKHVAVISVLVSVKFFRSRMPLNRYWIDDVFECRGEAIDGVVLRLTNLLFT